MFKAVRLAVALVCIAASVSAIAQPNNVILEGHVYDDTGAPLSGAKIHLNPLRTFEGPLIGAASDKSGYFRLSTPPLGKTQVSASKNDAGYPDTTGILFTSPGDHEIVVDLSGDQPITQVEIHLNKPDGIIIGLVVDKESRAVIRTAGIEMAWVEDPRVSYSGTLPDLPDPGSFIYALPKRPISIKITSPGYMPWTYVNQQSNFKYLEIDSGERVPVLVELQREAASTR